MSAAFEVMQEGFTTAASPSVSDLLAADSKPIEPGLLAEGNHRPAKSTIPFKRYFDPEFAKLEMDKIWKTSWQVVGREEDMPEVGDRQPYTVGDLSYLIIRSASDEFRALQNACLHRGTRLCDGPSAGASIKCPFHGWEWNTDGSLKNIPSRWDFASVTDEAYHLPEAKVGRWGGFIFINPDVNAGPLEDSLGVIASHFGARDAQDRFTAVAFRKKLWANWKLVLEAFLEAYHIIETHSNALGFNSDTTTKYDIWDDGENQVSRLITPSAVPSGHLGDGASRLAAAQEALETFAMMTPGIPLPELTSAETGRAQVAEFRRSTLGPGFGVDLSAVSDSAMLDATQYFMFPNFCAWFGEGLPLAYQFGPLGSDPNESYMEIRITLPLAPGAPRPPAAEMIEVDFDTPISTIPAAGFIGTVFDQDFSNLPLVQLGVRSPRADDAAITLGRYQECRIQALHEMIDRKLAK